MLEHSGSQAGQPALESAAAQPETDPLLLNSRAAVLLDGDTGRILYGKNETEVLPMASTTKIMTCILALENAGPDTEVLISDRAGIDAGGKAACEKRGKIPPERSPVFHDAGIPQ